MKRSVKLELTGKIRRKREKLLHYMFSRENNGTFFLSWLFLGATQEGSVRVLLSDVLFSRATCYVALVWKLECKICMGI